jgi:hypothetical protein
MVDSLLRLSKSPNHEIAAAACRVLMKVRPADGRARLIAFLNTGEYDTALAALDMARDESDPAVVTAVTSLLNRQARIARPYSVARPAVLSDRTRPEWEARRREEEARLALAQVQLLHLKILATRVTSVARDAQGARALCRLATDATDPLLRAFAVRALRDAPRETVHRTLGKGLDSRDVPTVVNTLHALLETAGPQSTMPPGALERIERLLRTFILAETQVLEGRAAARKARTAKTRTAATEEIAAGIAVYDALLEPMEDCGDEIPPGSPLYAGFTMLRRRVQTGRTAAVRSAQPRQPSSTRRPPATRGRPRYTPPR